jgi:hypothetical protein
MNSICGADTTGNLPVTKINNRRFFSKIKRPEHEAYHSLPPNAEVLNDRKIHT